MVTTEHGTDENGSPAPTSWGADVWQRFVADIRALDGTSDVFGRRRAIVLRLLAHGLPVSSLEALLPDWSHYLRPLGPPAQE